MTLRDIGNWIEKRLTEIGNSIDRFFVSWQAYWSDELALVDVPLWHLFFGLLLTSAIAYTIYRIAAAFVREYWEGLKYMFDK